MNCTLFKTITLLHGNFPPIAAVVDGCLFDDKIT